MQKRNYLLDLFSKLRLKIVSWPFKVLMVFIFLFLIGWGTYFYLFNQNPLKETTFTSITEKGLKIEVLDTNNDNIFTLSSMPQFIVSSSNLPQMVIDAVLAVNFILNDSKKACSPNQPLDVQLKNECSYVYTDIVAKEYILNNLIKANIAKGDKTEDLFFKIKQYVVTSWLKKHFTMTDFFTFFLNYSYYGDNVIGINSAVNKFFSKPLNANNLAPREAAFLAKKIFDNNSYIYSNSSKSYLVTEDRILEAMEELGYLSRNELDKAKKSKLNISESSSNDIYKMYGNSMISVALTKTDHANDITIYSTLNKKIHEGLALNLFSLGITYNIPSIAVYGIDNGNIVTGLSFNIINSVAKYTNRYPLVKIRYLLRPLFYLGLYNNGIGVPHSLINPNVQDIISDQNISPSSITKYFPIFAEGMGNNIDINNANHQSVLNKIAMQLVNIENGLFNKLSPKDIEILIKNFMLPVDEFEKTDKKYSFTGNFENIVNSFAILNQNGKYYSPIFINQVNEDNLKKSVVTNTPFDKSAIDKTLTVIKTEKILDQKYKVIYDNNMAIVYYKSFTIGVWLGNNDVDPDKNLNTVRLTALQKVVQAIAQTLINYINEEETKSTESHKVNVVNDSVKEVKNVNQQPNDENTSTNKTNKPL